jgi:hypothetical protein
VRHRRGGTRAGGRMVEADAKEERALADVWRGNERVRV